MEEARECIHVQTIDLRALFKKGPVEAISVVCDKHVWPHFLQASEDDDSSVGVRRDGDRGGGQLQKNSLDCVPQAIHTMISSKKRRIRACSLASLKMENGPGKSGCTVSRRGDAYMLTPNIAATEIHAQTTIPETHFNNPQAGPQYASK